MKEKEKVHKGRESCANKEETLRLLEGLIKYQQPSKASTWNRQEAQAHAQR